MLHRCGCSTFAFRRLTALLHLKLFAGEAGRFLLDRVEGDLFLLVLNLMIQIDVVVTYLDMAWLLLRVYVRLK